MSVVELPQLGGCACGQVRYRLQAAPLLAYACHCHGCQKRSGSAFALTLVLRSADLETAGAVEALRMSSPSGREIEHGLCPECRYRLFARAPQALDFMSLRAGTLDDASWVSPVVQTWAESAIPWAVIPGVRSEPPETFDFVRLGRDWARTAPRFASA